jgi:hypothetical protein
MADARRWRVVRIPETLGERLDVLVEQMQRAYAEGRLDVPTAMCERIPPWYAIQAALDEQAARRVRSRRPRRKQPV